MKPPYALQNGLWWHKKTQNLEMVNLKCATHAQLTPLSLTKMETDTNFQ